MDKAYSTHSTMTQGVVGGPVVLVNLYLLIVFRFVVT